MIIRERERETVCMYNDHKRERDSLHDDNDDDDDDDDICVYFLCIHPLATTKNRWFSQ